MEHNSRQKTLRLWSAACASGEEAYSLAMLVHMLLPERDDWNILIIGSDINPTILAQAKRARYGHWSFRMAPSDIKRRYFRQQGSEWILSEAIRSMVRFQLVDLINTPFPNDTLRDMDLILCRNLFIYFDRDTISAVANKLAAAISDGGYLMTAHSELSGINLAHMRSRIFTESVVYQRVDAIPIPTPNSVRIETFNALDIANIEPKPVSTQVALTDSLPLTPMAEPSIEDRLSAAKRYADKGEYDQAERLCHQIIKRIPLATAPYFLLAQLAQLKGEFDVAEALLQKTLYLDPNCIAATLELAALCERNKNASRAQILRRAALDIVRMLPAETKVEPYDMTAKEMVQWLSQ